MARIVYCHPQLAQNAYHVFSDLDFWDARRILKNLAEVRRNFGAHVDGDLFPTQVILNDLHRPSIHVIETRIQKAVASPPRHVVVRSMVFEGQFEFDPLVYYPSRWSRERMMHFTLHRLPLEQSSLCNQYQVIQLRWIDGKIRVEKVQRLKKHQPTIRSQKESDRLLHVPSCF